MASVKVKFRPSSIEGHEGTVYYQIIHRRNIRQLISDIHILPCYWDDASSSILLPAHDPVRSVLLDCHKRISRDLARLKSIANHLDKEAQPYSAEDIIDGYNNFRNSASLSAYITEISERMRHNSRIRTAETYLAALRSFLTFRGGCDMLLDELDTKIVENYEAWLKRRGVVPNTISFYTRILRAIYNRAVEEGLITDRNPFSHVYTGIDKTVKRALPLSLLRKIRSLDLTSRPALSYARDMFLLSFMLRGMSFIDMAFLKKSDLKRGFISYRRKKTGQSLTIAWTVEMQNILDKYPADSSLYLFPIIKEQDTDERTSYRNRSAAINRNLKTIAAMAGISMPLSMYVARHSWASVARSKGIPISIISEGMGHESESTTRIYLASIDTTAVDLANSKIVKSLTLIDKSR